MWLIAAASLTLLPGARWHPAGGVGCGKARLRIPVAAAADTRSSSLEKRITKVESMLVELKALDVSEELVQSIKDELQMLKMTNLEDKVAAAMSQAAPRTDKVGLVVPTAPLKWSDKQLPAPTAVESASSALEEAVRAFDYGQRAATKAQRLQLRSAIDSARAAGVPETDLAVAMQLGQQAEATALKAAAADQQAAEKAAANNQAEAAGVAEARQAAYAAIDAALRGIDYGQRAATEPELQQLNEAIERARGTALTLTLTLTFTLTPTLTPTLALALNLALTLSP